MKEKNDKDGPKCYKISVVGDKSVGKSSMMFFLFYDGWSVKNIDLPTIGPPLYLANYDFDSENPKSQSLVRLVIFRETESLEHIRLVKESYRKHFLGTSAVVLTFDVSNPESLTSTLKWAELIIEIIGKQVPFILIGTKSDLEYQVDESSVKKIAHELNAPYYYVSSKKNPEKTRSIFEKIARMVHGLDD